VKKILIYVTLALTLLLPASNSFSQNLYSGSFLPSLKLNNKQSPLSKNDIPSSGASAGFNLGVGSIEGDVAFAIGAFIEFKAKGIAFVPQTNYWKAKDQKSNFEIAGLARFSLSEKPVIPYIDGGLGINFYNSEKEDFTKLSIIAGGGVELTNVSSSFSLLFDGKYKLIVSDKGNLSCFIFTVGMKFPFK